MKHLKLFFALFAMLALGVTNAWAQTVTWEKATSIAAGDVVVLVCETKTMELSGISTTSTKYGTGETYTSTPAGKYELTVEEGSSSGTFSFKNGSDYLYWSSGNSLNKTTTKNANASWKVTFSSGDATILNAQDNTRKLQWNASSPRFACYTGAQTAVQLYKKVISDEPADVIVKTLKSIAVEGATTDYETGDIFKFDGTCTATYSVTTNDVPQEDETKEVTPTSVSTPDMSTVGEKEVTVTYIEDEVTVTATYTINVTENSINPGTYALALNNTFFGCGTGNNETEQVKRSDDILVTAGCLSTASSKTYYDAGHVRFYVDSYLKLSVPAGYVITSIEFAEPSSSAKWNGSITVDAGTYTEDTKTWAGSAQEVVFSFAAQNRIATATVTYAEAGDTPEVPTLDAPTFDLEEGTYNEAKEVTLSAEEGTIYYTLDGTTPDAESIEYTTPIVLNECGEITIKAIAISGEITSSVASATYTIKLPLNNSQANPYTEDEAIEVYNGGCYDNQEVYVKGVVANAQFYSSNTYTITLEGGFQFYYFYEAAGEVTFTEDYIVAGDTLVACGKLDNYKGTYQLAAGCYLVERKPYSAPKVDISNTKETAYTVEEAIALIDDITSDLTKQVYVKGTVSEIVTEYNDEYGNITYNISSDGSTSSPQFQLYRGKSYDGEKFTSADDIKVGDKVVVYGEMKKHNSTYEMNAGNQLVALEREDTTTGVDNVEATVAAKKAIINGQLVIVKDGVKFNALGQVIK